MLQSLSRAAKFTALPQSFRLFALQFIVLATIASDFVVANRLLSLDKSKSVSWSMAPMFGIVLKDEVKNSYVINFHFSLFSQQKNFAFLAQNLGMIFRTQPGEIQILN